MGQWSKLLPTAKYGKPKPLAYAAGIPQLKAGLLLERPGTHTDIVVFPVRPVGVK